MPRLENSDNVQPSGFGRVMSLYLTRVWYASKSSGVALIVHPTLVLESFRDEVRPLPGHLDAVEWQRERVGFQRRENDRRDFATVEVCLVVLMGYIEGRDQYARRLGEALGSHISARELSTDSVPSYTHMRNFLIGELDAHPVTAAIAAFRQRVFHNKLAAHDRAEHYGGRDKVPDYGWL